MKRIIKSLAAVLLYLLLLCYLLGTEAVLLLSPRHIGMFVLGCFILCFPSLEGKTSWKEFRGIFKKNAIMAGYLETFVLLFASASQKKIVPGDFLGEFALSLRPIFYGFVCHVILREEGLDPKASDGESRLGEISSEKEIAKEGPSKEYSPQNDALKKASKPPVPPVQRTEPHQKPDLSRLTKQERLIAELIGRGLTNREIGEELYISEATVKKHVSNIFEKTGISSRKELR